MALELVSCYRRGNFGVLLETAEFTSKQGAVEKDWQVSRGGFGGKKYFLGVT